MERSIAVILIGLFAIVGWPLLYVSFIRCERYSAGTTPRTTTAAAFAASMSWT